MKTEAGICVVFHLKVNVQEQKVNKQNKTCETVYFFHKKNLQLPKNCDKVGSALCVLTLIVELISMLKICLNENK